jgi:hypothetical protein
MDVYSFLTPSIASHIRLAQAGKVYDEIIFEDKSQTWGQNDYLFFIKPEITLPSDTIRLERVLELILGQISNFGFRIHDVRILSSDYMKTFHLIEQHYGVISEVSNQGVKALAPAAREKFAEIYGIMPDEAFVLGGMEFLRKYSFFNDHSLNCLWQNTPNFKLASGTYVEKLQIDLDTLYLLNAFHPKQLRHFTEKGRSIVLFNLSNDRSWHEARTFFIGATDPIHAASGSLRRLLLEQKEELGIPVVSQSFNGVHLSAGPVEGLIELHRFDSDHSRPDGESDYLDFPFGRMLFEAFGEIPESILQNQMVKVGEKLMSVFDLTEEKDAVEAVCLLKKAVLI